jgi:hypothetical protein
MSKKETHQYFLDPWYTESKEEAVTYLRGVGIDPEKAKREFMAFVRTYEIGMELEPPEVHV